MKIENVNSSISNSTFITNVDACCKKCGKPLIISNKYGMFCEDNCFEEESIIAYNKLNKVMSIFENFTLKTK